MAAGKKVNANVLIFDEVTGERHFIEAGEVPPAKLRDQLGDHLFVKRDDEADAPPVQTPPAVPDQPPATTPDGGDEPPPRGGAGSGRDEWAAYAAAHGVDVEDGQSRDDIVAALEAAGVVAAE